ncbi:MAG TPA: hypothetical protein VKV06_01570 [Acidimicrobiales bacterium]|nr:hypothetical protein [Acidimicrobiales bacterium]
MIPPRPAPRTARRPAIDVAGRQAPVTGSSRRIGAPIGAGPAGAGATVVLDGGLTAVR